MDKGKLKEILHLHQLWLNSDPAGKRANLTGTILPYGETFINSWEVRL